MTPYYLIRDGQIIEQKRVPHAEATQDEKDKWSDIRATHTLRERVRPVKEVVDMLNKKSNA